MLGNAYANALLDNLPDPLWLALFTTDPGATGAAGEVSAPEYVRRSISLSAASGRKRTLSTSVMFPEAESFWGVIGYVGLFGSIDGSDFIGGGELTEDDGEGGRVPAHRLIQTGDVLEFAASALEIRF